MNVVPSLSDKPPQTKPVYLPDEIVLMIQAPLDPLDRLSAARVNQQWSRVADDEKYWRKAVAKEVARVAAHAPLPEVPPAPLTWQRVYRLDCQAIAAEREAKRLKWTYLYLDKDHRGGFRTWRKDMREVRELGWYHPFEFMLLGCCLIGAGWYASRRNPEWDVLPHLHRPTWTQAILAAAVCCLLPQVPLYAVGGFLWATYQGARVTLCPPWAAVRTVTRVPTYISASLDRVRSTPMLEAARDAWVAAGMRANRLYASRNKVVETCQGYSGARR